jgi:hypothetical protein
VLSIEQISKFANKALPSVQRTAAGLEPYAGPWGFDQIAHLLRRTMFGPSRSDIMNLLPQTRSQIVELLLAAQPAPNPPLNVNSNDTAVPVGTTWINAPTNTSNGSRNSSLKSWWVGLILNQPVSLTEKMTLFWQNHYVSESDVVNDARVVPPPPAFPFGQALSIGINGNATRRSPNKTTRELQGSLRSAGA